MGKLELTLFCAYAFLPFIFGAPTPSDESLKQQQQIAPLPELYKNEAAYWNMVYPQSQGRNLPLTHPFIHYGLANAMLQNQIDALTAQNFGPQKRNFDEIDRAGFGSFVKKNFDEIDRVGFGFNKKRNFDEIDRSGFGSFVKRTA